MRGIVVVMAILAAGCSGPVAVPTAEAEAETGPEPPAFTWSDPIRLTPDGEHGYEPSIEASAEGIVVTAARTQEDSVGGSWLWWSRDGTSFVPVGNPVAPSHATPGLEGDIAIDASDGRLYFVDTYGADQTLSVWQLGVGGPAWSSTRPVQGTTAGDDRPWLAAADGVVYYTENGMAPTPNPTGTNSLLANSYLYRSVDGGLTWTAITTLPSAYCPVAARDQVAIVGCNASDGKVYALRSDDGGATWTPRTAVASRERLNGDRFPAVAVDTDGTGYFAWIDGSHERGDDDTTVHLSRSPPGSADWTTTDVPYNGTASYVAVAAHNGTVAVAFYGMQDDDTWYGEVMYTHDAMSAAPTWMADRFDPEPVRSGRLPNPDLFQIAYGPDATLHVAYGRHVGGSQIGAIGSNFDDIRADVWYVQGRIDPVVSPTPASG